MLVAVEASGVCLSDLHLIDGQLALRDVEVVTLGHEVAGVVVDVGPEVPVSVRDGSRVALQAGQSCGTCANCARRREPCLDTRTRGVDYDGGWAEYALARHDTLVPVPDNLPLDQAAIIPDAVSTPYAAIVGTGAVGVAQAVGIWGAGGLGAHGVRIARLVGAAPIIAIDPLPAARDRALLFGADVALDPSDPRFAEAVADATGGLGLRVALDFAGVPAAQEQALAVLGLAGVLLLVGLSARPVTITDSTAFSVRDNQVRGHYGSAPEHVEQLVRLASTGRLDLAPSITAHIPLADAAAAVARLADKTGDPIRLVLTP